MMLQRSLLSGTSEQVDKGLKELRELQRRRRDAVVSGFGAAMTVSSLKMYADGLHGILATGLDVSAALASDPEVFSSSDDNLSDAEMHNKP